MVVILLMIGIDYQLDLIYRTLCVLKYLNSNNYSLILKEKMFLSEFPYLQHMINIQIIFKLLVLKLLQLMDFILMHKLVSEQINVLLYSQLCYKLLQKIHHQEEILELEQLKILYNKLLKDFQKILILDLLYSQLMK